MTKIIAHRGAWKEFQLPQNSISSLKKAIEIECFASEFDVHNTKDNTLIVFHDDYLNDQKIEEYTYQELKAFPLSNGEFIPTLEDFLRIGLNQTTTKLILEIKSSSTNSEKTLQTVKLVSNTIKKLNIEPNQLEMILFSWEAALLAKQLQPKFNISYLNGDKNCTEIISMGLDGIDYHYDIFVNDKKILLDAHLNDLITNAWTVNNWDVAQKLIKQNIKYLTTDFPQLFLNKIQKITNE